MFFHKSLNVSTGGNSDIVIYSFLSPEISIEMPLRACEVSSSYSSRNISNHHTPIQPAKSLLFIPSPQPCTTKYQVGEIHNRFSLCYSLFPHRKTKKERPLIITTTYNQSICTQFPPLVFLYTYSIRSLTTQLSRYLYYGFLHVLDWTNTCRNHHSIHGSTTVLTILSYPIAC